MEPLGIMLSCQVAADQARSGLPDTPTRPSRRPRPSRRTRLATVLRHAADPATAERAAAGARQAG
jgi:hypothetical protein